MVLRLCLGRDTALVDVDGDGVRCDGSCGDGGGSVRLLLFVCVQPDACIADELGNVLWPEVSDDAGFVSDADLDVRFILNERPVEDHGSFREAAAYGVESWLGLGACFVDGEAVEGMDPVSVFNFGVTSFQVVLYVFRCSPYNAVP